MPGVDNCQVLQKKKVCMKILKKELWSIPRIPNNQIIIHREDLCFFFSLQLGPDLLKLELLHVFINFIHLSLIGFNHRTHFVMTVTVGAVFNVP